jgi:hypothetical protein
MRQDQLPKTGEMSATRLDVAEVGDLGMEEEEIWEDGDDGDEQVAEKKKMRRMGMMMMGRV